MLFVAVRLHADENILRNGDFEDIAGGLPHMWSTDIYGEDHAGVRFYVESQGAYSGNNYVTIENIRPNDSKLTQYLTVKPNTIYKFSCWIKAEGIGDKALGANITVLDILETSRDFKDAEGNWEYVEFYGRTGIKQKHITVTARLGGYGNLNTGKASFDDYKVEQVSTTPAGVKVINLFREKSKDVKQQRLSAVKFISLPAVVIYCFLFIGLFIVAYNIISRETELPKTEGKRAILVFYLLLSAGWILRIIISPVIEGYPTDMLCFKAWSNVAATQGLSNFYTSDMFVDYPPGYIYILYLIGYVRNLFSLGFNSDVFLILLKSPAILADIISSAIIFQLSKKKLGVVIAATLSLLYVFNPAIICNSTVYGQIDSFFTLFVLLTLVFVYKDKLGIASIIFVLAVLIKPQALIFTPIGIYALIQKRSLKTAGLSLLYMTLAFIIIIFPFSIKQNLFWIFELYSKTLSSYPFAAVNAFNLFAFFGGNGANVNETFFIFSYKVWGGIFTVALVAYLTLLYFVSTHKSKPFFIAMFVTAAFFVLSHKMHERYIFPVIALAIMSYIYTNDKRLLFLFAGFSITAFLNQVLLIDMVLTRELFD
jgi:Gpi18-like mannosyltransferase